MELTNSSAVVTGGASGLGAAAARALSQRGARVVVFDRNEAGAKQVADEVGGDYVAGDVTDGDDCQKAVDRAAESGTLRVAVNCAGTGFAGRTINRDGTPHDPRAFEFILRLNVIGTFNVMIRAASAMASTEPLEDGERGVIVNTASVAAFDGQIGQLAYSASKGAVVSMTLPAARDLSVVGIRVVTIAPGLFDTPLLAMLPDEQRRALGESVLFPKRLGAPEQFGDLVAAIVGNPYLNGEVIRLDGGIRMPPR
ncbi:MAG TPA: SDR family NAD(P)-dependent oxidoreductase [Acidimicrobiia bacterium]|nr:SDR family NAD(P)-dependent oxidoreductase [Acidimicrobiia bacterium]